MSISASQHFNFLWGEYKRQVLSILPSLKYNPYAEDQAEGISRATPAAMLGHCLNTTIGAVALAPATHAAELLIWAGTSYAIAAYVFFRRVRPARRKRRIGQRDLRRLERHSLWFAAILALPWSYLAVRYLGDLPPQSEIILISLGVGMAASGAVLLAPLERAAVVYATTVLAPTVFKCLFVLNDAEYLLLATLAISYWLFLLALIGATNQVYRKKSQAVARLTEALAQTQAAHEKIEHLALHDSLTELPNRRAFLHRLNGAIMRAGATGCAPWAVLLLDLDRFKVVNDTLGHKVGDVLLQQVADRLRTCVRPGDLIARLGGDEFSIIAENIYDISEAEQIASRMIAELERPFQIQGRSLSVGVSIGIAVPPSPETDNEQVMRRADLAMYEAKASGRNGFKVFELEMQDRMDARSVVEMGLRAAVTRREFELYFQPIYELASLKLVRFEALIRWHHPTKGLLAPLEFLPVAEEIGLINEIGQWALREACRLATSWPSDVSVAVNLSPLQVNHTHVVELVEKALRDTGLPHERLELEITETALLSDTLQTKQKLERLRALGVKLSMDDFGTGYSSLSYLATYPLDSIKIDKSFIAGFATRNENAEIVRAMVELAKALNRTSTVEGIETIAQLNAAQALGATYGQGFYFGAPEPESTVRPLLQMRKSMVDALQTGASPEAHARKAV